MTARYSLNQRPKALIDLHFGRDDGLPIVAPSILPPIL
jgi:hypothetical protein